MTEIQVKPARNQAIECARLIASFFVVFIHCEFPEKLGDIVIRFGEQAVPMFFAISGYFCYRLSSEKIWNRMIRTLKLLLVSMLLYYAWNIFTVVYVHGSVAEYLLEAIPSPFQIAYMVLFNMPPYFIHLWYLMAMAKTYFVLWLYTKFFGKERVNYHPLYLVSLCFVAERFLADLITMGSQLPVTPYWNSSTIFRGLPIVALGLFLREYQERIFENFNLKTSNQLIMYVVGFVLTLIQWNGGISAMHIGTVVSVVALMLFLVTHPVVTAADSWLGKCISRFGFLSMTIYITHMIFVQTYERKLQIHFEAFLGSVEPWVRPLVVVLMSLIGAIVCDVALTQAKRIFAKRKK